VAVMRINNLFSDVSHCHPQHGQDHFKQLTAEKIVTIQDAMDYIKDQGGES
jgi:hypothetical protein